MIQITDRRDCCGCMACVQRCPKHCISLQNDKEGFMYPNVDSIRCINCNLCEKVCPMLCKFEAGRKPVFVYAAKNPDELIRRCSSSGGVFTALAENNIDQGGVVFGACFDENWNVAHDFAETKNDLQRFRGSKYVQSYIGDSYNQVEVFLKAGRKVLFSGTPCQVAGLNKFLRKPYEGLYTVDFICHGVPSPSIWCEYLKEEVARQRDRKNSVLSHPIFEKNVLIEDISFRNKIEGWKKFSFSLTLSTTNGGGKKISFCSHMPYTENIFMKGFMANLYLRPSCYVCPTRCGRSGSNITLGDFWGIDDVRPDLNDGQGISVVLVNDSKGKALLEGVELYLWKVKYEDVLRNNVALEVSAREPANRKKFWDDNGKRLSKRIEKYTSFPLKLRIKYATIKFVSNMLGEKWKKSVSGLFKRW